ncbi:phenazine biosynthesis protein phzF like [Vibrio ishigakensis]|uniref:Phenazine biosynthesis protein phzF like n=1 Tax=Vibrio ishigakensis TaxID=1481914 RepID=A0A0B8P2X5_9VIBR|nr:PhzF family phenazine biosynthesis protein [Vibrio ishigakensis]GAM58902.1 phenazine biosynthesis protein phzF like [Vibrio ishigakensis]
MIKVEALLVNSFTKQGTGGNPAGVVLGAETLSDQQKLQVAKLVGFSETAFVCEDHVADFEVSFFTTTDEVDFCGHATLVAFSVMLERGLITPGEYTQRTKAGLLAVTVEPGGRIVMQQKLPEYLGVLSSKEISPLIGISCELLDSTELPIEVVSTGLPDIIVPITKGYLDNLQINNTRLSQFCKERDLVGIHAFELCESDSLVSANCRNFAPLFGIPEESATGSASGALASYLIKYGLAASEQNLVFEQGRAMGCTSEITASIEVTEDEISKVSVGGFAKLVGVQEISL